MFSGTIFNSFLLATITLVETFAHIMIGFATYRFARFFVDSYFEAVRPKLEAAYSELRTTDKKASASANSLKRKRTDAAASADARGTDVDPMSAGHLEEVFAALRRLRADLPSASAKSATTGGQQQRHAPW